MQRIVMILSACLLLGAGTLLAEEQRAELYFGIDGFTGETNYSVEYSGYRPLGLYNYDKDLDQDGIRLKFGAELEDNWRVQGYLQGEKIEAMDNKAYGIGVDVIKGFELTPKLQPFVLAGVGLHSMELNDKYGVVYDDDYATGFSLKVGFGLMYRLTKAFELVGGLDWQYRAWSDVDVVEVRAGNVYAYTLEQDDTSTTFYAGLNFHF